MYFLVDFENVRSEGLRGVEYLNRNDCITLFFSSSAQNCENRYLEEIDKSGCSFDICKLIKPGKNALDFYIATRLGEFYGQGHDDRAVIISKDHGFNALRDYWDKKLPQNKRLVLSPSIEKGLISSNENSERTKRLKRRLNNVDIEIFQAKYEERKRMRDLLSNIFGTTTFADKVNEIQEMIETGKNKKVIYLNSLHRFGKKQGLEIYDRLKPMLSKEYEENNGYENISLDEFYKTDIV